MYLSSESIKNAIDDLRTVEHTKSGHLDLLTLYLILRLQGVRKTNWKLSEEVYDKDQILSDLMLLGGLASIDEGPNTNCCMFFTSLANKQFFNPKTPFRNLPSRLKDTIDNSAVDHILEKNQNYIKFSLDAIDNLISNYSKKYNLYSVICWIYRFQFFEAEVSIRDLKKAFQNQFDFTDNEVFQLFDTKNNYVIKYSEDMWSFEALRVYLDVQNEVGFAKINFPYDLATLNIGKLIGSFQIMDSSIKATPEIIKEVLLNYKQLILTGVPGVGKSYFINRLKDFFEVTLIQFHQNYSYQDFICGQTLTQGSVTLKKGVLLDLIKKANESPKNNFLLVLDEINRGNISAIFGELMFLLDRGDNSIFLPELNLNISLPENLFILGTMNTADRSLAILDYALRRRFPFIELFPDYDLLDQLLAIQKSNGEIERIFGKFLQKVNNNIEQVLKSKDYKLGHSYLLKIRERSGFKTQEPYIVNSRELAFVLFYEMIPMIVEYNNGDTSCLISIFSDEILNCEEANLIESIVIYNEN